MTGSASSSISEFLELVRRNLGATDVRVLKEGEVPLPSEGTLVCELPLGQLLSVAFAKPPADPNSARRRLEMLVRAFATTLAQAADEQTEAPTKGQALRGELAALVERANALDAFVIDAHSPAIWGGASEQLPEVVVDDPMSEPDNVFRIDGQPRYPRPSDLAERARALGLRLFEAIAIDPRAMELVPREICEKYRLIPLFGIGTGLLLSMADPTDVAAIHEVILLTGLEVEPSLGNDRLIRFVLKWNEGAPSRTVPEVLEALDPEQEMARRTLADKAKDRWSKYFATRRAIQLVRGMPEVQTLHRGGHLNKTVSQPDYTLVARSFAAIYVLVVVFPGPFDELRAKHAISQALPVIESLVLALPPRDPPPSLAGAKAMRGPIRR